MKKRLLAFALLLPMLLSLIPTVLAAEGNSDLSQYGKYYVALGDSFTRGMGASENWYDEVYRMDGIPGQVISVDGEPMVASKYCRNVTGTYSKRVADAIGCYSPDNILDRSATYWPIAQNGLTTCFFADLMGLDDGGYFETDYTHNPEYTLPLSRYTTDLYYFGNVNSINAEGTGRYGKTGVAGDILQMLKSAKLITIELGMSDILNRPGSVLIDYVEAGGLASIIHVPSLIYSQLNEAFQYWKTDYALILDYIKENNPDATVVLVGALNVVFNLTIADGTLLPVGSAFSLFSAKMNQCYKQWAEDYDYIYVDISNVDLEGMEADTPLLKVDFASPDIHPSYSGYEQIARLILDALEKHNGITETAPKDIVVDIGRFDSVDRVKVNGIPVAKKNYTVKDHILTIHHYSRLATSLTITTKLNGKTALSTYHLAHHDGHYVAHRTYTTNNILRVPDYWMNQITSLFAKS